MTADSCRQVLTVPDSSLTHQTVCAGTGLAELSAIFDHPPPVGRWGRKAPAIGRHGWGRVGRSDGQGERGVRGKTLTGGGREGNNSLSHLLLSLFTCQRNCQRPVRTCQRRCQLHPLPGPAAWCRPPRPPPSSSSSSTSPPLEPTHLDPCTSTEPPSLSRALPAAAATSTALTAGSP